MVAAVLALTMGGMPSGVEVVRDDWGVPKVKARTWEAGFFAFGSAVAEDRLWQMELSRRLARGRMAELSPEYRRSDEATLRQAYTDEELTTQLRALPEEVQRAFASYAEGVTWQMAKREQEGKLPEGYGRFRIKPEPWTPLDSAAVAVNLMRRFGTGGAGELRTMALIEYLKTQKVKGRELDVIDDIAWFNDPEAPTTLRREDEKGRPSVLPFQKPTRAQTLAHLAQLPPASLLELAGAVAMTTQEPQRLVAANVGVANQWGSYAAAVSASRSRTGRAFLLGGPQMGHSTPSVIHEAALDIPGYRVQGMNVPGIPMIAAGTTPHHAWTVTTGAADIEDIFASELSGRDAYRYGQETRPVQKVAFVRRTHEGQEFTVVQERTHHGPVVLRTGKALFSKQSPLWKTELSGVASVFRLAESDEENPIDAALEGATACFNIFIATTKGDIAWRFTGKMPIRARGLDPRLPTPSRPDTEWKGFLSDGDMPHVFRPRAGLLANWNNKPARWFPNGDTPAWGRFFRSRLLDDALGKGRLGRGDLERAIWTIARRDAGHPEAFHGLWTSDSPRLAAELAGFDAWALEGSGPALVHRTAVQTLRQEIFSPWIGNLTSPALFNQAIQPEVIWAAAQGKTKFNYLEGRSRALVVGEVMKKVEAALWGGEASAIRRGFRPGSIGVPNQPAIPYIDRGTYIQITEMTQPPTARSIASPGVQEEGPQALSQVPLARAWQMKPCWQFE